MNCHLKIGDRVEHPECKLNNSKGTVEHADESYVRVKWDDGQIGLLYFDEAMIPNARRLIRLAK